MRRCVLLLLIAACGGKKDPTPAQTASPGGSGVAEEPAATLPSPPLPADFPEGTRSLQLVRTVPVRLDPGDDGKRIGTIAIDTRVGWKRTARAKGCGKPWVEIQPRGWVCGDSLEATKKAPSGREVPLLDKGAIVPGDYGRIAGPNATTYTFPRPEKKPKTTKKADKKKKAGPVTSPTDVDPALADEAAPAGKLIEDKPILGTLTLRIYEELTVDGKLYYRIDPRQKEYVLASQVHKLSPSPFMGSRMGDDTGWALPFGFVWPRSNMTAAWTYAQPGRVSYRQINARTPVPVLETAEGKDGKPIAYRIGPGEWMLPGDVRLFHVAPPPPQLRPGERWIDVDLDSQMLVAFEGDVPVYATLISSGLKDTATTTGIYRVWLKESEADMKNLKAEDPYSVATVPWTQFFYPDEDLALHTAYWHNEFGRQRSHGCVNLAPRDARWLYYWSDPQIPPGWTAATGVVEAPGSVVRVRSAADPNPEWKGYAKKVLESRQAVQPL